jgi:hypothetical protein
MQLRVDYYIFISRCSHSEAVPNELLGTVFSTLIQSAAQEQVFPCADWIMPL